MGEACQPWSEPVDAAIGDAVRLRRIERLLGAVALAPTGRAELVERIDAALLDLEISADRA